MAAAAAAAAVSDDLRRALELTESEHDEHADTIRRVLKSPEIDVNRLQQSKKYCDELIEKVRQAVVFEEDVDIFRNMLNKPTYWVALHVACDYNIRL